MPSEGRPRSKEADRSILDAARELLIVEGYDGLHLEHVAAKAGVGKATIYRRWSSKEQLAQALLEELAAGHIFVPDLGNTRDEVLEVVMNAVRGLTETAFGPVVRALLSQIAINHKLGDPFRASVVQARRDQVAAVIGRGVERGDLRPSTDVAIATELLVGPVYFRLMFGGTLDQDFAERVVISFLKGNADEERKPTAEF